MQAKTVKTFSNELYKKSIAIHSKKVLYMPIAKSASMAIKSELVKKEHEYLSKDQIASDYMDYDKITVVRNVYERLVDCFLFFTETVPKSKHTLGIEFSTFEDFIKTVADTPDDGSNCHFRSQFNTLSHDGVFLPNTVLDIKHIHDVVNFLPINSVKVYEGTYTDTTDYRTLYNDRLVELVNKRFQKDIEFFGFKFEE